MISRRGASKSGETAGHVLADLPVPPLSGSALAALRESIRRDGQLQPILVDEEGTVWDGRSRWLACRELGLEPKEQRISREQGLQAAIASTIRREMTPLERADFVAWLERENAHCGTNSVPGSGRKTGGADIAPGGGRNHGGTNSVPADRRSQGGIQSIPADRRSQGGIQSIPADRRSQGGADIAPEPDGGRARAKLSRFLREQLGWRHDASEAQVARLLRLAKATPAERELVKDAPTVREALRRLREAKTVRVAPPRRDPTPAEQEFLDAARACLATVDRLDEVCTETFVMATALRRQLGVLVRRATAPRPGGQTRTEDPQYQTPHQHGAHPHPSSSHRKEEAMNRTVLKTLSLGTLLALASNVSCTTPVDDEVAREGEQQGDTSTGVDDLAAPNEQPGDGGSSPGRDMTERTMPTASFPDCDDSGDCCPDGYEVIEGTAGNDNLDGPFMTASCLVGLAGNDSLDGSAHADNVLLGGPGVDDIDGGFYSDIVLGGDGDDDIRTAQGQDEIDGGPGNDYIDSSLDDDVVFGGEGADTIRTSSGADWVDGGPGDDDIQLGFDDDTAFGGEGNDAIEASTGQNWISGGPGDDSLDGGLNDDYIEGNAGDDVITGSTGHDVLVPGPGLDHVEGEIGDDTVVIYHVCELEPGEVLDGGFSGDDTLITPVDVATLEGTYGVTVSGFEHVIVEADPCASECTTCLNVTTAIAEAVEPAPFDTLADPVPRTPDDWGHEVDDFFLTNPPIPPPPPPENCAPEDVPQTFQPPRTVGDGLVWDARPIRLADPHVVEALGPDDELAYETGADADFATEGFYPLALESAVSVAQNPTTEYFEYETTGLRAYMSDEDSNYAHVTKTYFWQNDETPEDAYDAEVMDGFRPIAVDVFETTGDLPRPGMTVSWIRDDGLVQDVGWQLVYNLSQSQYDALFDGPSTWRPISVSVDPDAYGDLRYSAIIVDDGVDTDMWHQQSFSEEEMATGPQQILDTQYLYPFSMNTYGGPDGARFHLLFTRRPVGLGIVARMGLTHDDLKWVDRLRRREGYTVGSLVSYETDGNTRYAAVWERYRPEWRATGSTGGGPMFDDLFGHLEKAAFDHMKNADAEGNPGNVTPAGAVAVYLDGALAWARGLTYAPAIYRTTAPHDALALASVSKSITAVGLMREMESEGIVLDASLGTTLQQEQPGHVWELYQGALDPLPMKDLLQHTAGWGGAPPWNDYPLVHDSPYGGSYPVTSDMLIKYTNFFLSGGWPYFTGWKYSNYAFTVAASMAASLAEMPGDEASYFTQQLFEPVGMTCRTIPATSARRLFQPWEVDRVSTAYVTDVGHAYRKQPGEEGYENPMFELTDGVVFPLHLNVTGVSGTPDNTAKYTAGGQLTYTDANLGAGGWTSSAPELGLFMQAAAPPTGIYMSEAWAKEMWTPTNFIEIEGGEAADEEDVLYGLGWYRWGQWSIAAGSMPGASAIAAHNRRFDVTIVMLFNRGVNPFTFFNPLMEDVLDGLFPCTDLTDDHYYGAEIDECTPQVGH